MNENTAIEAHALSKRYGRRYAVDDVSFRVPAGRITGFLGPNGAGKTTTLRMLAGLVKPTSGSSRLLGLPVPGPALRQVGTMIEEPSFYPYMTGRRNLEHAALLHGNLDPSRIREVLGFVHMDQAADKRVGAYSQGMRQRLGLARALLQEPRILLLDEPTNGLDPAGIAEIRENLRLIARQGVTILISSHILAELEKLVEHVLVIERGRMLFDGSLGELVQQISEATLRYRLRAEDQALLLTQLGEQGLAAEELPDGWVRTSVTVQEADDFLGRLLAAGVTVQEAVREQESLENAYLRLLREDGRPS